ncbi:unnamed protein product, partial [Ectocarpus sp. 12 AP-2014]
TYLFSCLPCRSSWTNLRTHDRNVQHRATATTQHNTNHTQDENVRVLLLAKPHRPPSSQLRTPASSPEQNKRVFTCYPSDLFVSLKTTNMFLAGGLHRRSIHAPR